MALRATHITTIQLMVLKGPHATHLPVFASYCPAPSPCRSVTLYYVHVTVMQDEISAGCWSVLWKCGTAV